MESEGLKRQKNPSGRHNNNPGVSFFKLEIESANFISTSNFKKKNKTLGSLQYKLFEKASEKIKKKPKK